VTHTIFTGCSFTEGIGLKDTKLSPDHWANLLHNKINSFKNTRLLNLGAGGSTNDEIFHNAINAIGTHDCKYLFVAWTSFNRYKLNPGVELYPTQIYVSPTVCFDDINLNPGITYTKKFLNHFRDTMLILNHDHYHYVKILNYSHTIKILCEKLNITVFFVNAILPHDDGYFSIITKNGRVPSDTTVYTQQEFCADSRTDEEFFKIYDQIHQNYTDTSGLECNWLNLDTGFRNKFNLDLGTDQSHPGPASHQAFGAHLTKKLQARGL